MKVIYTNQAYESLIDLSHFLLEELDWDESKVLDFRKKLLDKADRLETTFNHYQEEEYLDHLGKGHRRVIEGLVKIIYRIEGDIIYITDFFDTRQDPSKMKE
ncbi:MAG: type II toxin-antitoxin system RelE/ParE family toxin [Cyclobacteriaceae bacterium]